MAVPATIVVLSPLSGWLYDRIGARYLTTGGLVLSGLALLGLALLKATSSPLEIAGKLALLGAGQSIFLSPNSASVLSKVSEEYLRNNLRHSGHRQKSWHGYRSDSCRGAFFLVV